MKMQNASRRLNLRPKTEKKIMKCNRAICGTYHFLKDRTYNGYSDPEAYKAI